MLEGSPLDSDVQQDVGANCLGVDKEADSYESSRSSAGARDLAEPAGLTDTVPQSSSHKESMGAAEWGRTEMRRFQEMVGAVLLTEDLTFGSRREEPEREHPAEADAVEVCMEHAHRAIMRYVVSPILQDADGAAFARRELPAIMDEVFAALRTTWHLSRLRGHRAGQLGEDLAPTPAVPAAPAVVPEERRETHAAGFEVEHGDKAEEPMEGTVSLLTAARKSLKEKEWELADVRQRAQQLERDRARQEHQIRHWETLVSRETLVRDDAYRRAIDERSEADAEAVKQRADLLQRLAAAERALDEERGGAARRAEAAEELRRRSDLRADGLTAELAESRHRVQFLQQRLEVADPELEHPAHQPHPVDGDAPARAAGRTSVNGKQRGSRRSDPDAPRLRSQPGAVATLPSTNPTPIRAMSMQSLPMDLRALGKLLTGNAMNAMKPPRVSQPPAGR